MTSIIPQNTDYLRDNMIQFAQNANKSALELSVHDVRDPITHQTTKKLVQNGFIKRILIKCLGREEENKKRIAGLYNEIRSLGPQLGLNHLIDRGEYTELFFAAQQFNQVTIDSDQKPLFNDIRKYVEALPNPDDPTQPLVAEVWRRQAPSEANTRPHIVNSGCLPQRKLFYYSPKDLEYSHRAEAMRIFICTQSERLMSLIGRIVEAIARRMGKSVTFFNKYHYFRNGEDLRPSEIYAHDKPIAPPNEYLQPTSYWIGHATNLLNIPLKSKSGNVISVSVITDPVEDDLNTLLYPRMTKAARTIEQCPAIHVYMLSHNHLDHYHQSTIQKLLTQQPVMIVPEGDVERFEKLGFKHVHALTWWEKAEINLRNPGADDKDSVTLNITAVPANHWSGQKAHDAHQSLFSGYVIKHSQGDIYFAGDTAVLSTQNMKELGKKFKLGTIFQPGGPDERRADMESTHQCSAEGLCSHVELMIYPYFIRCDYGHGMNKEDFIKLCIDVGFATVFNHTKTYKLGNLHFDDTDRSIAAVLDVLANPNDKAKMAALKDYEKKVVEKLRSLGENCIFHDGVLELPDLHRILKAGVVIPKIGERTGLFQGNRGRG